MIFVLFFFVGSYFFWLVILISSNLALGFGANVMVVVVATVVLVKV